MNSQQQQQSGSPFLNLPLELVESVVIFATLQGCYTAASTIAQTCRSMRILVYGAADQHLWRELFLAVFDDPRYAFRVDRTDPGRQYRKLTEDEEQVYERPQTDGTFEAEHVFDWGTEFRVRVWARRYISSRASLKAHGKASPRETEVNKMIQDSKAFETITSVVATALPSPPTVIISMLPENSPITDDGLPLALSLNSPYPVFPPPPTAYSSILHAASTTTLPSFAQLSSQPFVSASVVLGHNVSANIRWTEELIAEGLPADLLKKLSGAAMYGGTQGVWDDQNEAKQIRAFCKLLGCTGFTPIPADSSTETGKSSSIPGTHSMSTSSEVTMENGICRVDDTLDSSHTTSIASGDTSFQSASSSSDTPLSEDSSPSGKGRETVEDLMDVEMLDVGADSDLPMTIECQQNRARRLARMRVYNLRYLHPDRHWGPYLLPPSSDRKMSEPSSEDFLQPILELFADHDAGHPNHHHNHEDEEEEEEEEEEDSHDGDNEGLQDDTHEGPDLQIPHFGAPSGKLRNATDLYPDWVYLAAVRIVVEANLREAVSEKDVSGLVWLDSLRRDSAPKAVKREEDSDEYSFSGSLSCIGNAVQGEAAGWDWAGVTGSWRRCVCWMDYRDLILQNVAKSATAFTGISLGEAVRIIPMRLRVVSYSPCPIPGYPHRPTLHVVGESAGPAGSGAMRKMKGTVGVIADGSIRWSLYSLIDEEGTTEWITEGIQLGEARSAMGVLGMWTGAQHDRMDPLGPFWMWKVG